MNFLSLTNSQINFVILVKFPSPPRPTQKKTEKKRNRKEKEEFLEKGCIDTETKFILRDAWEILKTIYHEIKAPHINNFICLTAPHYEDLFCCHSRYGGSNSAFRIECVSRKRIRDGRKGDEAILYSQC